MSAFSETAADLADAFSDLLDTFGESIIYNGESIRAVITENQFSQEIGMMGIDGNVSFSVMIAKDSLESKPQIGGKFSARGQAFRIMSVSENITVYTITPGPATR